MIDPRNSFQRWLDQGEDDWDPDECGDRDGEPAEKYDLGCMVMILATVVCWVATVVLIVWGVSR